MSTVHDPSTRQTLTVAHMRIYMGVRLVIIQVCRIPLWSCARQSNTVGLATGLLLHIPGQVFHATFNPSKK